MRKLLVVCLAAGVIAGVLYYSGVFAPDRVEDTPDTALAGSRTPLDVYVQAADPAYRHEFIQGFESRGVRGSLLRMISQEWLTEAEVNRTEWEHYLWVYTPAKVQYDTGMLFITGGANDGKVPKPSEDFANIARDSGSVVTELRMVPNQPLVFKNDDYGPRKEDELISYGWRRYLEGSKDPKWLARLPMTKAAVRAMDTITAFSTTERGGRATVNRFVVAGASKRGWTAWTTAAADKRVTGVVPIVIDLLNIEKSFVYHYRKYGFWATAVGDYFREGIMDRIEDPEFRAMMAIVDPYAYRERYTMPKYMVNAAQDQFFRPESSRFYYAGLPGEKHLRYVPNAGHDVGRGTDALATITAFYQALLGGERRPSLEWTVERDGSLRVTADVAPTAVRLWAGNNPKFNDFRLESAGPVYQSTTLEPVAANTWTGRAPEPDAGFTAYFVEAEWARPSGKPFKFTTEVLVTPETFPSGPPVKGKTVLGPETQR